MNDPLKVNIGIGSARLDVNALVRWFREAPVREVAYRFLKVFNEHGVRNTQIQRLISEVTLDKISSPQALYPALTNDVLDKTATLFGIQRAWLDGVDDQMYRPKSAYQQAETFFGELGALSSRGWHPLRAYCVDPKLDRWSDRQQPLVLVFTEPIADWDDDEDRVRYRPLTETWNWTYAKSRIQLKAMLWAAWKHCDLAIVPLIKIGERELADLAEGRAVPPREARRCSGISLEDYIRTPEESCVAKEADELETVWACMSAMGIDAMAKAAATQQL